MEVILREHVDNLGSRGDVVKVASGYARNYLLPKKLALPVTEASKRQIEREREKAEARDAEERAAAEALSQRVSGFDISIARRVGENNTMYGSVTSADVAQALAAKGFDVDKRKITLAEPIKSLGEHTVQVKVHRDVTAEVKVKVVSESARPRAGCLGPDQARTTNGRRSGGRLLLRERGVISAQAGRIVERHAVVFDPGVRVEAAAGEPRAQAQLCREAAAREQVHERQRAGEAGARQGRVDGGALHRPDHGVDRRAGVAGRWRGANADESKHSRQAGGADGDREQRDQQRRRERRGAFIAGKTPPPLPSGHRVILRQSRGARLGVSF